MSQIVILALAAVAAAAPPTKLDALRDALQLQLNELSVAHPEWALQLGWSSEEGNFGVAAGVVDDKTVESSERLARPTSVYDRFLFGSGTKPLTSVAVLRLMEQGVLSLDDPISKHVDPILTAKNGTSMTDLFGSQAADVTVGDLLRMQSGLADFDTPTLDDDILTHGDEEWPPYAILRAAAGSTPPINFPPGSQTEYSSTNYVLAGLVLLAHDADAGSDWTKLDLFKLAFPPELAAAYKNVSFVNDGPISATATVAGFSGMIKGTMTSIWAQRGGVLGWTCGNMAASTIDVARFYRDLLVTKVSAQWPPCALLALARLVTARRPALLARRSVSSSPTCPLIHSLSPLPALSFTAHPPARDGRPDGAIQRALLWLVQGAPLVRSAVRCWPPMSSNDSNTDLPLTALDGPRTPSTAGMAPD